MANVLPPADVIALLTVYQARFTLILRRHGGVIDKFLGDCILASFGAAERSEIYAQDACAVLWAFMDESARWAAKRQATGLPPIQVIGAAAGGRFIYGAVCDSDRLEMTMISDAVNFVVKLEKHARTEARRALVSLDRYALAERQGFQPAGLVEHLPARAVEGVSRPIDLVALSA